MRKDKHLMRDCREMLDELLCAGPPETVQAGEWVIENDNLITELRVLLERS